MPWDPDTDKTLQASNVGEIQDVHRDLPILEAAYIGDYFVAPTWSIEAVNARESAGQKSTYGTRTCCVRTVSCIGTRLGSQNS